MAAYKGSAGYKGSKNEFGFNSQVLLPCLSPLVALLPDPRASSSTPCIIQAMNPLPSRMTTPMESTCVRSSLLSSGMQGTREMPGRVKLASAIISLGAQFSSAPSNRSKGWTVSVHPEGKRYAHKFTEDRISVITEAHATDPVVAGQLEGCLAVIRILAAKEDIHLSETTDSFLEIEIDQNSRNCSYWFADHTHRTIFWLRPVDTNTVGLPNSYSKRHLQYALEENYWTHVEIFPATASQYSMTALNDLHDIFLNARADALTSDIPTFPYTAEECDRFINLLQCRKEHASSPSVTTFVARLWVVVAHHCFSTHFGEDHHRMSCTHSVVEVPAGKRGLFSTALPQGCGTAIVHGLPRASFMWAFFLFAIQGFWMAFGDLPMMILLPTMISVAVVLVLVCFGVSPHPRERPLE
ncbi:hypothetical protein DFH94DRAFT_134644 [Russula ochroleuca]|uniref:Uncharacterized protein n=1 Tax=Russula ochroleuca TaxID=152965 RepID=A0A9P5MR80_9AGAM|nr:hypothetical protein DFH94DRAFT_134644 [Russula ochroleuca]